MRTTVELKLQAKPELMTLVRFAAATVAAQASFSVEEIEDLRLASDELCLSLSGGDGEGYWELALSNDDDSIEITCTVDSGMVAQTSEDDPTGEWSLRILDALVDERGRESQGTKCQAWIRKRRSRSLM